MTTLVFDDQIFNREVSFCRVFGLENKQKLEKIFLKNRISYYIEWQERSFFSRIFGKEHQKEKNMFTIRINEADIERATQLVQGLESVKIKRTKQVSDTPSD